MADQLQRFPGVRAWLAAAVLVAMAAFGLTACGGKHQSTATNTATAATASPKPQVTLPMWSPDKRTGIAEIDAVIAAVTSGQAGPLLGLVKYEKVACSTNPPGPKCGADQPEGTEVDALQVTDCVGHMLGKTDVQSFAAKMVPANLYAVFRDTSGYRQVIFDRETGQGVVTRVTLDNDGAVIGLAVSCEEAGADRLAMLTEARIAYQYAPDRFILPPPK